jgi:hypothetical protein
LSVSGSNDTYSTCNKYHAGQCSFFNNANTYDFYHYPWNTKSVTLAGGGLYPMTYCKVSTASNEVQKEQTIQPEVATCYFFT